MWFLRQPACARVKLRPPAHGHPNSCSVGSAWAPRTDQASQAPYCSWSKVNFLLPSLSPRCILPRTQHWHVFAPLHQLMQFTKPPQQYPLSYHRFSAGLVTWMALYKGSITHHFKAGSELVQLGTAWWGQREEGAGFPLLCQWQDTNLAQPHKELHPEQAFSSFSPAF